MLDRQIDSFCIENCSLSNALHYLFIEEKIPVGKEIIYSQDRTDPKEGTGFGISLSLKNITIRHLLDALMDSTEHRYYWELDEDSQLINVIPVEKTNDETYLLNRKVDSFYVENKSPIGCIIKLLKQLQGRGGASGAGAWDELPRINVKKVNATVRQILDAIAKAGGIEWEYTGEGFRVFGMTPSGRIRAYFMVEKLLTGHISASGRIGNSF